MAIKVNRPADFGGNGIVVYVAKSAEEVDACRAGLTEAGIPVELPEAAVEALFAAGRSQLPIRVNPEFFKEAQKVIDAIYPPPLLELPPDDDAPAATAGAATASGPGVLADPDGDERKGPAIAAPQLEVARQQGTATRVKVEEQVPRALAVAGLSVLLPGVGFLTGAYSIYWSWWCMDRLKTGTLERGNAKMAFGVAIAAVVIQPVVCLAIAWKLGLLPH